MAVKLEALPTLSGPGKSFGGLIPFSDYSRWERRPLRRQVTKIRPRATLVQWSRAAGPFAAVQNESSTTSNKKKSAHSSNSLRAKLSIRSQEPVKIKILKSELSAKRGSLEVYQTYVKDLVAENVSIINSIISVEAKTHSSIDKILDRYQHFKGAMQTLKMRSEILMADAKQQLEETRSCLHRETEARRGKIMQVDESIEATSRQLQVLKHYKDKEHPTRQVRIEQLKEMQEEVRANQVAEREEIDLQIAEEREHYDHHMQAIKAELQARATDACLATTRKSIRLQAMQNKIMEKELAIHQKTKHELLEATNELKNAILSMRRELLSSHMAKKFPRCLPETEITLNIPTQERLPI